MIKYRNQMAFNKDDYDYVECDETNPSAVCTLVRKDGTREACNNDVDFNFAEKTVARGWWYRVEEQADGCTDSSGG